MTVTFTNDPIADPALAEVTGTTADVAPGETVSLTFTDVNNQTTTATERWWPVMVPITTTG